MHRHAKMTKAEWEGIYREAWSLYYTETHGDDPAARGGDRY
jgi:hypothetical protein